MNNEFLYMASTKKKKETEVPTYFSQEIQT